MRNRVDYNASLVIAYTCTMLNPDGLAVFSKHACPTCALIEPVMQRVAKAVPAFQIVSQDDPKFPPGVAGVVDDRELDHSWQNNIEATPTLIRYQGGREVERVVGWDRDGWRRLTGIRDLGEGLPAFRPG
jgi:thiol-disulfide isomerase/thioredoxin